MSIYLDHITYVESMQDSINDFALDMYKSGRADMLEKCIEIVKYHENEYDGICWAIRELEELKEQK